MNLTGLLEAMAKLKASDLHLKVDGPPTLRINGRLRPIDHPPVTSEDIAQVQQSIVPSRLREAFVKDGSVDFTHVLPKIGRFRVVAFHQRGQVSISFRRVNLTVPLIDELNLPAVVKQLLQARRGLLLVTGVTGSGKSTTLAALIQQINLSRREHIVTLEDPIEYIFTDKLSIINQLEVGVDCQSFAQAMTRVVRFDPNIVMVGEMRDRETVETALQATDTGHLVMSTLHTSDAKQTMNRILNFFTKEEEKLILEQLALNLHAIVSQRLLPRTDITGLIPACEILINVPIVTKLIMEGRIEDIQQVLKNAEGGMQSFDISLAGLVKENKIAMEVALEHCSDESMFRRMLRGESSAGDRAGLIGGGY